jgi:transposase
MDKIARKPRQWGRQLVRWAKKVGDAAMVIRAQVVDLTARGKTVAEITDILGCARSHVYRTVDRFSQDGRDGLFDERRNNGQLLANDIFCEAVDQIVSQTPQQYGYLRPTWTRELLVKVSQEQTGIEVSVTVMGRVLRSIGARRGRPKPIVECRLSERQKRRRLAQIRKTVQNLPENEVAVYEDEVDIHLNPKIGLDWMSHGQQKQVITPGQNEKAYVAGTLDARDGTVLWVGEGSKNSALFVKMLEKLNHYYRRAKTIHVILDNYGIHKSQEVNKARLRLPRIRLHFLPPYCPDHNKIERLWQDLHANVTRNHRHSNLVDLCKAVARFLNEISPWICGRCPLHLKVA